MENQLPLYTVQKIDKKDVLYGPTHYSEDGNTTNCGQGVNENWSYLTNTSDARCTCKKCLKG